MLPSFTLLSVSVIAALLLFIFIRTVLFSEEKHRFCTRGKGIKSGRDPSTIPGWTTSRARDALGDIRDIISKGGVHKYLQFHHKGGRCPIFSFTWRDKRVVSVCSPEAYKDMQKLTNRPGDIFTQYDCLHAPNSIQCVNSDAWEERRAVLHRTIKGRVLGSFFPVIHSVAQKLHDRWSAVPSKTPIAILPDIQEMNLMAILLSCFTVDIDNETLQKLAQAYHHCKTETELRTLGHPEPQSERELDFQANLKLIKDYIVQMMEDRRNSSSDTELPCMDALLHSGFPIEQIVEDVLSFIGGFHTSAYYLAMLFWYLARHHDVQDKLFDEIEKEVGDDHGDRLKHYTLKSKTYLRHVLDEGLRIGMTANFSAHCSDEDEVIGGYTIPANTPVLQALGVTMMDDYIWEKPNSFYPERFIDKLSNGAAFLPFGVPPKRKCPADQFTYFMGGMYITQVMKDYIVDASHDEDVSQLYGLVSAPKSQVFVKLLPREK